MFKALTAELKRVLLTIAQKLHDWSRREAAREHADVDDIPRITLTLMGRLIIRSVPFLRPMWIHIVALFLGGTFLLILFTFTGTISGDMWNNKMLINDKLQPVQVAVIFVDETYLRTEFLSEEARLRVEEAGFGGDDLTEDQRKTVRDRMLVWFLVGVISEIFLFMLLAYYNTWVWQNVNQYLRVSMIEKLEYLSLSFHHTHRSGDAIYRIYQDSSMIVNVLEQCVIGPFNTLRDLAIAVLFLMAFDWVLGLVIFLAIIPMVILTAIATPKIRQLSVRNRVANSNLTSRLQEVFNCIKVVKATQSEGIMIRRFDEDSTRALDAALYIRFAMVLLSLAVGVIGACVVIVLEYFMATWVVVERATNMPGWAVAFVGFAIWSYAAHDSASGRVEQVTGTARGFVRLWCQLQDLFIGLERAFYFLDLKPNVIDPAVPVDFPDSVKSVSWDDVHFRYETEKPVLKGATLRADSGTVTAIVGGTGSGKSTLMSLLLRLYDPEQGEVRINDTSVKDFAVEDMRKHSAIALQKNVLFTGKVRENIAYALDAATDDDVVAASTLACAHEFIQELDGGYNAQLGERGSKLSSGQRQRLTIARAVIRNTPILILDEPTASLDAETEQQVLNNLAEWGHDKIVFLITHRISTIRNADQIAFLEDGKIVEVGSHDELIGRENGRYRQFVRAEIDSVSDAIGGGVA